MECLREVLGTDSFSVGYVWWGDTLFPRCASFWHYL